MKKLKIFLWLAAILVIGLIFFQNQALYFTEQKLSLDLFVYKISFPPIHNGAIILLFFSSGVLLSAASRFMRAFKARNTLKKCEATGEGYIDKIGDLKTQLDQVKSRYASKGDDLRSSAMDAEPSGDHTPA